MPVIVYKTLEVTAIYAQVRRIACEACSQPYVYLAVGTQKTQTTGLPLVSSDEGMRKTVSDQLQKTLEKVGRQRRLGEGMCPHCQRYQPWMVRWSRLGGLTKGCLLGALGGAIGGLVLAIGLTATDMIRSRSFGSALVAGVVIGVVGGLALGWRKALSSQPYEGMEDPRAMTVDRFEAFLGMCKDKDYEPTLAWYAMSGGKFDPKFPVIPLPAYEEV